MTTPASFTQTLEHRQAERTTETRDNHHSYKDYEWRLSSRLKHPPRSAIEH